MEIVGGVASVVGIVGFAGQMVSGVQKMIEFWDSVKDAPEEIVDIKSQLRVLGSLLTEIESQTLDGNETTSGIGRECLLSCRSSMAKLEKLSQKLDSGLNSKGVHRKWTCLQKAFREKELEKYARELLSVKSTLIMFQTFQNTQHHASSLAMLVEINQKLQLSSISYHTNTDHHRQSITTQEAQKYRLRRIYISKNTYGVRLSFGAIKVVVRTYVLAGHEENLSISQAVQWPKQREIKTSFLPSFIRVLNPRGWIITQSQGSWKHGFQTFNVRPGESSVFSFARGGNMIEIQQLLSKGLASVNDMNTQGETLLSCALINKEVEVSRFLLENGALARWHTLFSPQIQNVSASSTGTILSHNDSSRPDGMLNLLEYVLSNCNEDLLDMFIIMKTSRLELLDSNLQHWVLTRTISTYEVDETLLAILANTGALSFESLSFLARRGVDITTRRTLLGSDWWQEKYGEGGRSLLQNAVVCWIQAYNEPDSIVDPNDEDYRNKLEVTLQAYWYNRSRPKFDLHYQAKSGDTFLGLIINAFFMKIYYPRRRPLTDYQFKRSRILDYWLQIVVHEGYNIKDYIQRERSIFKPRRYHILTPVTYARRYMPHLANIFAEIRFGTEAPWVWFVFQGPAEIENDVFLKDISECECWSTISLERAKFFKVSHKLDVQGKRSENSSSKAREITNHQEKLPRALSIWQRAIWYTRVAIEYRMEFSVYLLILSLSLGSTYVSAARVSLLFYVVLDILSRVASSVFRPLENWELSDNNLLLC